MILLDSNVLSELMRQVPAPPVLTWLDLQPRDRLYISAITRAEIELGIALLPEGRRKEALAVAAGRMFAEFHGRCLPFEEAAASHYAAIVSVRTRAGRQISVEDAEIAATALANGFVLATRNTRDFEGIEGLLTVDPWLRFSPTS